MPYYQGTPQYDFTVKQGATFEKVVKFRSLTTGELQSLDDIVSARLVARPSSGDLVELTHDGPTDHKLTIDKTEKKIRIYIADEVTDTYAWRDAPYELDLTNSVGEISRKLRGKLVLEKKVA